MNNTISYYSPAYENEKEAYKVLAIIVAEFESDPMSVQCFDLRVVQRAKDVVAKRKELERKGIMPPLLLENSDER